MKKFFAVIFVAALLLGGVSTLSDPGTGGHSMEVAIDPGTGGHVVQPEFDPGTGGH
jgi:hypothetical protein